MARTLTRHRTSDTTKSDYTPVDDVANAPDKDESPDSGRRGRRKTQHTDEPKITKPEVQSGWDAADKAKAESGDFPDELKVTDEAVLIHFLQPEPMAVYKQHWIERNGKKSFTCLAGGCPLCDDVGDRPSTKIVFNVVDFTDLDKPVNVIWTVGSRMATTLKNLSADKKTGPLDRDDLYFSVSKSGKGTKTVYVVNPVKQRDLEEDWEIEALTAEEIDEFLANVYENDIVEFSSKRQLTEIADEILAD